MNGRVRLKAENDRMFQELALRDEEIRIKDARMARIAPQRGPHWATWLPFALPQRWPWSWWVVVVVDHFSRRIAGVGVFSSRPDCRAVCVFLAQVIHRAGTAPKYIVYPSSCESRRAQRVSVLPSGGDQSACSLTFTARTEAQKSLDYHTRSKIPRNDGHQDSLGQRSRGIVTQAVSRFRLGHQFWRRAGTIVREH